MICVRSRPLNEMQDVAIHQRNDGRTIMMQVCRRLPSTASRMRDSIRRVIFLGVPCTGLFYLNPTLFQREEGKNRMKRKYDERVYVFTPNGPAERSSFGGTKTRSN